MHREDNAVGWKPERQAEPEATEEHLTTKTQRHEEDTTAQRTDHRALPALTTYRSTTYHRRSAALAFPELDIPMPPCYAAFDERRRLRSASRERQLRMVSLGFDWG
jgi:hypothetical protein